ncbi:MAG: DUF72 domain-containing protein [Opitutus sp.]|nr:DUF72 domain-containing protein [Opitutus sp.]
MAGEIRIGISGWRYPPWRGTFYPPDLTQAKELHYASRQVRTIEINGSFYSLQRPEYYAAWRDDTPDDFVFSVKGGRYLTHLRRLKDVAQPLANFFASGVLQLGAKLGPFLWQLPPMFTFKAERLADFFQLLPRNTRDAARLARRHSLPADRSSIEVLVERPLRHALEVRHASFLTPEFVTLLHQHDIAVVVADTAGKWPLIEDVTSDFVYVRLHGDEELYVSGYTDAALNDWARKIRAWSRGTEARGTKRLGGPNPEARERDVFVYFDNDVKVRAPYDAMALAHKLKLGPKPAAAPIIDADVRPLLAAARERWPGYGRERKRQRSATRVARASRTRRKVQRSR